ncbi:MAG: CHASE2 domain-containing protein, partial [Lachnospiraceae bacterium]|nr:CHASE2 domain-containing protein [Lachnospiraceae bacterium]
MKKKTANKKLYTVVLPIVLSAVLALLCLAGILKRPDRWIQDTLYQEEKAWSGRIVVIGIDEKALSEIGPYQTWGRGVVASALEVLAADPEHMP